ncbi:MAG: transposase, partial [Gammaproteobacteria bacterium]
MGNKIQVPNRQYTDEFRFEAVRLAESIGGNAAAKRLGIPDSSLWNWLRLSRAGKLKVKH